MDKLKHLIPSKIFDVLEKTGINTTKQLILLSLWDMKKITHLNEEDIKLLKNLVADSISPKIVSYYDLSKQNSKSKISMGCEEIDNILHGGLETGTITELYGESGAGKTQIGLQAAAHIWPFYTVYICTEDLFPVKRFEDVKKSIPNYNPKTDYGSSTFVEHITESKDLLSCVSVRLPKLLVQNNFKLIVIDSIAAPFRVETTNYVQRAEEMRELAMSLLNVAQKFKLAVLCINQVTSSLENMSDLPALGLAWSNMVSTRLFLKKTSKIVDFKSKDANFKSHIRELSVTFAPDLPNSTVKFVVTTDGIKGI